MRSTGPIAALAAATMMLALAGCSGSGGGDGLTYEDSPLSQYVAATWGGDLSDEEQQKASEQTRLQVEELVAQCMSDEGFEYVPITDSGTTYSASEDGDWEPDSREWVEKYGYGMINSPFTERMEDEPGEESVDPNQTYIESLSESEQTAYYETLFGASPDEDELNEDGSYEYRWEDGGCQGAAQHEVEGEDIWQSDDFAGIRDKMNEFWTTSQQAPELAELNAEWSTCMADKGEPGFPAQSDASQSINDAQNKIYEDAYGDGSEPVDADAPEPADPNESPEMKALAEREIEVALVDLECREKTSYTEESLKIQFALEERFIAENKAELDAFKAAAEQSK